MDGKWGNTWRRFTHPYGFPLHCKERPVMSRCYFLLALLFLITVSTEFVDISCDDTNVKKAINVTKVGRVWYSRLLRRELMTPLVVTPSLLRRRPGAAERRMLLVPPTILLLSVARTSIWMTMYCSWSSLSHRSTIAMWLNLQEETTLLPICSPHMWRMIENTKSSLGWEWYFN